jgi:hypothetical protein
VAHGFYDGGTGGIAGQHHIEVGQVTLAQTLVEVGNFRGGCASSLELPVSGVVAYIMG